MARERGEKLKGKREKKREGQRREDKRERLWGRQRDRGREDDDKQR